MTNVKRDRRRRTVSAMILLDLDLATHRPDAIKRKCVISNGNNGHDSTTLENFSSSNLGIGLPFAMYLVVPKVMQPSCPDCIERKESQ
jgi:hypothetical protein